MVSPPTRYERMELRRVFREPRMAFSPWPFAPVLWPHACFACRKSWKLNEASTAKCPQCRSDLHWMGRGFKAPRRTDREQWVKVQMLWTAGFRFPSHTGWRTPEPEPYPERLREVKDYIRRNQTHPFRVAASGD